VKRNTFSLLIYRSGTPPRGAPFVAVPAPGGDAEGEPQPEAEGEPDGERDAEAEPLPLRGPEPVALPALLKR
jgi:hypothetical protein